jgi:hypothetical protein
MCVFSGRLKDERWLRCAYLILHRYLEIDENIQVKNDPIANSDLLKNMVNKFIRGEALLSPNAKYYCDFLGDGSDKESWLKKEINAEYQQRILTAKELEWIKQLDVRGMNWLKTAVVSNFVNFYIPAIDMTLDYASVEYEIDYSPGSLTTGMPIDTIENKRSWIESIKKDVGRYINKQEQFEWLKSDLFDTGKWAYDYLKKSDYELVKLHALNPKDFRGSFKVGYDAIYFQPKGHLLQKGFIKELRSAFRVQSHRKELELKELAVRSYDLSLTTIEKIDEVAKESKCTKREVIENAVSMLYNSMKVEEGK